MYEANFKENDDIVIIDNVYQFDYNQQLKISGLELPSLIEIHFGIYNEETTITKLGYTENGVTVVDIPNDVLSQTQEVYAYVFLTNEGGGRTIKAVRFKPIKRGKPDTYVPVDDSIFLDQVIAKAVELQEKNESLNKTTENLIKRNEAIEEKFNKIQETYKKQSVSDPSLELIEARSSNRTGKSYEKIGNRLDDIENSFLRRIYGVKRKISDNSSSAWERIEGSIGLEALATKDGNEIKNDFDEIYPWSDIISYNYDVENDKITAFYGEPNFSFDGSNGEVLTKIPEFYWKREIVDDYEYIYISQYHLADFIKSEEFSLARYKMSIDSNNVAHSISGAFPVVYKNMKDHRDLSKTMGEEFCLMDYRFFIIQMLYLVEYADYNSQAKLGQGRTSFRYSDSDKALVSEENTNRIIINSNSAKNFIVGQYIKLGTVNAGQNNIASNLQIVRKEDYSEGTINGTAIYFDGSPVNIEIGNVISSQVQLTGGCDILGMKSGCLDNSGKSAVIYRGLEDIYGNAWERVDGVNLKNKQAFICYDPKEYVSDKFDEPYKPISYICPTQQNWIKREGFDENHPIVQLPVEVGGSSSTYMCDTVYTNGNGGNTVLLVGGHIHNGSSIGLFAAHISDPSRNVYNTIGCRVLKYQ